MTQHEWDRIEKETPNQYYWFCEFLNYPDFSLKEFHEKISTNNQQTINQNSDKKHRIPTYTTIRTWSFNNEWTKRKKAYLNWRTEQQRHRLEEATYKEMEDIHLGKIRLIKQAIQQAEEEFQEGQLSGYQFSNWCNGIAKLQDDNRVDLGKPTEISSIEADVKSESEVTVTDQELNQKIIMNPNYAALTREVLEELTDEKGDND